MAAAAYRSGESLTNQWDGHRHDYTSKGGIVYSEILLPNNAPADFTDRSVLWNSVEKVEKSRNAQLAREIEVALPVELNQQAQIALIRSYVQDNFVSAGMCADFAIHDKNDGNPHAHIMLTIRPFNEDKTWASKCRKEYLTNDQGQRIPDGKNGYKSRRVDITDWNSRDKAEAWRAAWAEYANRALEQAGRPERVDHRSYKRQGVEQIPTIHMGVAATRMEQRGIATDRGNINRQVAADNRLLKELKARITRLYNWSKEQAALSSPQKESILQKLWQAQQEITQPTSRYGKVKKLKESAALFNFLQQNGIESMQQLHEKVSSLNKAYYDLRGEIVKTERQIASLEERLKMWQQYQDNKAIHAKIENASSRKREQIETSYRAELTLFNTAEQYLQELKLNGESITPKKWQSKVSMLSTKKSKLYYEMYSIRKDIKAIEQLRRNSEEIDRISQIATREKTID